MEINWNHDVWIALWCGAVSFLTKNSAQHNILKEFSYRIWLIYSQNFTIVSLRNNLKPPIWLLSLRAKKCVEK